MSNTLSQFDEKLLLKLTLGQQLKQPLAVPDVLTSYVADEIETTQDLLQTNQYWMLLQQAGKQPEQASIKILEKLEKDAHIVVEESISEDLSSVIAWILVQERPHQYSDWFQEILKIAAAQQVVVPRRFVLKSASLERNGWRLASALPSIAFTGAVISSRLDEAKAFYAYIKNQDTEPLLKYLSQQNRSDWAYLMSVIGGNLSQLIQEKPVEFWKNAMETGQSISYMESVLTTNLPPLTQLKPIYEYLLSLDLKSAEAIKKKGGLYLYYYYQNEKIYPEFIQYIQDSISFDKDTKKLILQLDLARNEKFENLGVIASSESRALKNALASNLVDKTYQDFVNGEDGAKYVGKLFEYLPLAGWQLIFNDWSEMLQLSKYQQTYVLQSFILRCALEERHDLAFWFYQQQEKWLERYANNIRHETQDDRRIYALLKSLEAQQCLQQRLALHLKNLDEGKFWFVLQQSPHLLVHEWAAEYAIKMLLAVKVHLKESDTEKLEKLKEQANWLILNAKNSTFEQLSDLFSKKEWKYLSIILREKQQLQTLN